MENVLAGYYWCSVCEIKVEQIAVHSHGANPGLWHAGVRRCHRLEWWHPTTNPHTIVSPVCHIIRKLREYDKIDPAVEKPKSENRWRNVPAKCTQCASIVRQRVGDSFDRGEELSCKLADGKLIDGYADFGELTGPPPEWCPLAKD